jgi:mRNA-degrading endonuclease YafQ of YafQ-DinJ toxin-antitoxin module
MKIELSTKFRKSYKKIAARKPDVAIIALDKILFFAQDPYNPYLKLHKLKGILEGISAFSIEYDIRVLVDMSDYPNKVILIDIGTHDEVY